MRCSATYLLMFCILVSGAYGQSERIERIYLSIAESQVETGIEDGVKYRLGDATTSIDIEGRVMSIYRWIISAEDVNRVSARLTGGQWEPIEGAGDTIPEHPLLKVHSSQVWGQIRVVLLDLYPWRISGGRAEVLREGQVEVTIRHLEGEILEETTSSSQIIATIANQIPIRAEPSSKPLLGRPADTIPEGGSWLKIPIREDGLYHLTTTYLSDAGFTLSTLDPGTLRLFAPTHLGRPLPDEVGAPLEDNLVELAIHIRDSGDDRLNDNDDILFYAQGPRGVDLVANGLRYTQNPYTNEACVWLHVPAQVNGQDGKGMTMGPSYQASGNTITAGGTLFRHEVDAYNGFNSGPVWYQIAIKKGSPFSVNLPTPNLRSSDTTSLRIRLRGGTNSGYHQVTLALNQTEVMTSPGYWDSHEDITLAPPYEDIKEVVNITGQNKVTLRNSSLSSDPLEEVWLDWIEIEYGLDLTAVDDALTFMIKSQPEQADIRLAGFSTQPIVVDITDPTLPILFLADQQGQQDNNYLLTPQDVTKSRRYLAVTETELKTPYSPVIYEDLAFTNLRNQDHKADYIVITADTLQSTARELAMIHAEEVRPELRLDTLVATVDEIYREFSGGVVDPFAIRAFLKWAYYSWITPPSLVLLFGDGDYDYRNISGGSNILVPTIQVDDISEIESRAADDRFVYLEDSTFSGTPLPKLGIGRIAVSNPEDAGTAVEMVRRYMVEPEPGLWRQRVILAADDPARPNNNETDFILWSDTSYSKKIPPYLQVEKIYLTEYAEIRDPATNTVVKPDATADLIRSINQGVALVNYVGHGSSTQWAQEQLLKMDRDQILINPGDRLPVLFAGTCTWGRFDQIQKSSMSEVLTAGDEPKAIGVVSAVRTVYAWENFTFIERLFQQTFPLKEPSTDRIGEILRRAKVGSGSDEKFHLFGDPAILIAFPKDRLTLNPVTSEDSDTLKILGIAHYSGTTLGEIVSDGEGLVTVLDAPRRVARAYNTKSGDIDTLTYTLSGAPVFRGSVSINADSFQGRFVVPKDISYSDSASIIVYAWSEQGGILKEQIGYRNDLIIKGTADTLDTDGPIITAYWENRPLVSGDVLPEAAQIEVELKDPLGINITGEVGHAIRAWMDDESTAEVMDPLFRYDIDEYTSGRFNYQFDPSLSGRHDLYVEAWDGANNKAVVTNTLYLTLDEGLDVSDLFNFPNPFVENTTFVYTLSLPADVTITIYTLNGVKIRILEAVADQAGFQQLQWDGRDEFGDQIANGAYLYHFKAETLDYQTQIRWGRLARLR